MRWPWRKKSKVPQHLVQPVSPRTTDIVKTPTAEKISPVLSAAQEKRPDSILPQAAKQVEPQSAKKQTTPTRTDGPAFESPFGSAPPSGLDVSENDEITAIWAQVQARVALLAANEGKTINSGLEIDDVLANLDALHEKKEEFQRTQAVKVAFGRTMGLIKTIGGIVTEEASTVFAPAKQCYNLISFLIKAYEGYQGAFDSLAELLEKCSDHLGRLDYYVKGGMDKRLSKLAAQQLLLFVQICDAALNLRYSIAEKIKIGLKIAFLAENSIQGLLGEMAKLGERERGLVSAHTFSLASAAATSAAEGTASNKQVLNTLAQNRDEQKARAEHVDRKHTLIDVLAFDEGSSQWNSSKQAPVESWQIRYNKIRKDIVPGTGKWLFAHPAFQSWVSDFSSSPILAVEGTDITGKSYLTSSIVKFLRTEVITQYPGLRHLVSFFFLDQVEAGHSFDDAAKSLIWQLANKDEPYMRSAARISKKVGALDPTDIIPCLLLENEEFEHMNAVFYLIIDGMGDSLDPSLLQFLRQLLRIQNKKIRVFLTGTPKALEQIEKRGVACPSIPISRHNHDDVKKFIMARMDNIDALADTERPGISAQRQQICNDLLEAATGDYYKLDSALHVISTLDFMEDINRVIQRTRHDRAMQLHYEIGMLDHERSQRQIQEMNHIIRWITFAKGPVTGKLASSLLYLVTGEIPFRPLAEQIRSKYLLFNLNEKGHVEFRSSKALEAIPFRSELPGSNGKNGREIQPEEIDIVLHFLSNVCPPALYQKLELREYLQQKSSQKQHQIQQEDENTGHLQMALDCIRSFFYGDDTSLTPLRDYATHYFISHLSSVDLAMVDRDQKSQVGEALVRLFTRNESLDALMLPRDDINYQHWDSLEWLGEKDFIDEIVRWLRDTAAVSRATDKSDRSWIQSVVSDQSAAALFKPFAIRLSHRCLREPSSYIHVQDIYEYIKTFLHMISNGTDKDENKIVFIERFEKWAYEALQVAEKDTLWHTQMSMIYEGSDFTDEALERSKLALKMDPKNWRASIHRARLGPAKERVEILQRVIDRQTKDTAWMEDPSHAKDLGELNFYLADGYWEDEQFDLAIPIYATSFKQAPQHVIKIWRVLQSYLEEDRATEVISLFKELSVIESGNYLADLVFKDTGKNSIVIDLIADTFRDVAIATEDFAILDIIYEPVIRQAEKADDQETLRIVRYMYGDGLYCEHNRREDKVIELWETSLSNFRTSSDEDDDSEFLYKLIAKLAPLYLQKALAAKASLDPNTVANYLSRLSGMLPEGVAESQLDCPPQLWLARYYHLDGDDTKARQTVRSLLQVVIELLSDEKDWNDMNAFKKAHAVFTALDDDKNALTALAMQTRESRFRFETDRGWNMHLFCAGGCNRQWDLPSNMWICKDCVNVHLDDDCMTKLKGGQLERNICGRDHDFIKVPEWDGESLASLPKQMVPWGEQIITLDEWKQEIRKAYLDSDT